MTPELEHYLKHIQSLPLFEQLEQNDIATMLETKVISIMSFEPGEAVITEKSFGRRIFLIHKGKVKVVKDVLSKGGKKCKELKQLEGQGILLGEVTAFTGKPRTASVVTIEKTVCVVINIGLLMRTSSSIMERVVSKFYPSLFQLLCQRLDATNALVAELKQQNEDLGLKLKDANLERLGQKQEFLDDLRKKNSIIKELEARLELWD